VVLFIMDGVDETVNEWIDTGSSVADDAKSSPSALSTNENKYPFFRRMFTHPYRSLLTVSQQIVGQVLKTFLVKLSPRLFFKTPDSA
jgi:hypothetical protein